MASRLISDLSPETRKKVVEFLARLTELSIPIRIIETRRTQAEHDANVAKGVSWTAHSKHIDGNAIDVAPYATYNLDGAKTLQWDANHPVWGKIGAVGEGVGLTWGGRWKQRDMGHFEL